MTACRGKRPLQRKRYAESKEKPARRTREHSAYRYYCTREILLQEIFFLRHVLFARARGGIRLKALFFYLLPAYFAGSVGIFFYFFKCQLDAAPTHLKRIKDRGITFKCFKFVGFFVRFSRGSIVPFRLRLPIPGSIGVLTPARFHLAFHELQFRLQFLFKMRDFFRIHTP